MPIKIPDTLPAAQKLQSENIFVMFEERAQRQDIRPLDIIILNLMPQKIQTETQLLRLIGNTPIQINIELLQTVTHQSKNTSSEHLGKFYVGLDDIRDRRFDGMIITGAPIEHLPFEEVDYWPELCEIMEWSKTHVFSVFHICWGAQAALYYHHGIPKYPLGAKTSGVFSHKVLIPNHPLMRGFDSTFYAPHSRYTTIRQEDIEGVPELQILSASQKAGVYIAANENGRHFFVTGHSEYDPDTLAGEYFRDVGKGLDIAVPENYFPDDDPNNLPIVNWRAHATLLYSNWLNYFVYQETPYDLSTL